MLILQRKKAPNSFTNVQHAHKAIHFNIVLVLHTKTSQKKKYISNGNYIVSRMLSYNPAHTQKERERKKMMRCEKKKCVSKKVSNEHQIIYL